jgi:hypothetical protein
MFPTHIVVFKDILGVKSIQIGGFVNLLFTPRIPGLPLHVIIDNLLIAGVISDICEYKSGNHVLKWNKVYLMM